MMAKALGTMYFKQGDVKHVNEAFEQAKSLASLVRGLAW